jgi:hypothetical protein
MKPPFGTVVVDDDDALPLSGVEVGELELVEEELELVELDIEPPRVVHVPHADADPRTP